MVDTGTTVAAIGVTKKGSFTAPNSAELEPTVTATKGFGAWHTSHLSAPAGFCSVQSLQVQVGLGVVQASQERDKTLFSKVHGMHFQTPRLAVPISTLLERDGAGVQGLVATPPKRRSLASRIAAAVAAEPDGGRFALLGALGGRS